MHCSALVARFIWRGISASSFILHNYNLKIAIYILLLLLPFKHSCYYSFTPVLYPQINSFKFCFDNYIFKFAILILFFLLSLSYSNRYFNIFISFAKQLLSSFAYTNIQLQIKKLEKKNVEITITR
jgi:hypothetical protein